MITYTCDAAGCGNTSSTPLRELLGKHLCPRCERALANHVAAHLDDPEAQANDRAAQDGRDLVDEENARVALAEREAKLEVASAEHAAKRIDADPKRLLERLVARKKELGESTTDAIRGAIHDELSERNQSRRKAAEEKAEPAKQEPNKPQGKAQ